MNSELISIRNFRWNTHKRSVLIEETTRVYAQTGNEVRASTKGDREAEREGAGKLGDEDVTIF